MEILKAKEVFADNPDHDILRFFDFLPNFSFPTVETKYDY